MFAKGLDTTAIIPNTITTLLHFAHAKSSIAILALRPYNSAFCIIRTRQHHSLAEGLTRSFQQHYLIPRLPASCRAMAANVWGDHPIPSTSSRDNLS